MSEKIQFERLNSDWNAEPNAPEVEIAIAGNDLTLRFFLNAFQYERFNHGDCATLVFHDCLKYRYGAPNDEGFYVFGESRYKPFGVKWGEFYRVCGADWENDFPDAIFVSKQPHDALSHYLFYFRDGAFECVAKSYDLKFDPANNDAE